MAKRHLEKALQTLSNPQGVKVVWEPYMLNVDTPKEGVDLQKYLTAKYGAERTAAILKPGSPLDIAGQRVGIAWNRNRRVVNTISAHRLMEWCNSNHPDKADALMEAMFHGYFVECKDLNSNEILVNFAVGLGLSKEPVESVIAGDSFKDQVLAKDNHAKRSMRISGVPFIIFEKDKQTLDVLSGAQPPEAFIDILSANM